MTLKDLEQRRATYIRQRDNGLALANQATGAIAVLDGLIRDFDEADPAEPPPLNGAETAALA